MTANICFQFIWLSDTQQMNFQSFDRRTCTCVARRSVCTLYTAMRLLHTSSLQLRVSDVANGYLVLAEGLCDPTSEVTFELMVNYTLDRILVGVAGMGMVSPQQSLPEIGELLMTVGNTPGIIQPLFVLPL